MKNLIYIICFFVFVLSSYILKADDNIEKSINKRNHLLMQYDSLNAQIKDSTLFNIKNLALFQAKLIQNDNFIINDFLVINNNYKGLVISNKKLTAQLAENEAELTQKRNWIKWGMCGAGALFLLFLVISILFIVNLLKAGKLKNRIKELEKLHVQYEEQLKKLSTLENNNSKLLEVEASYNQIIAENKMNFENFEKENKAIKEKLSDAQYDTDILKSNLLTLQQENYNLLSQVEILKNNNGDEVTGTSQKFQEIINSKDEEIKKLNENLILVQQKMESSEIKNDNAEAELLLKKIQDLQNEIGLTESDLNEKHKYEKLKLSDEISDLRRLIEEEKLYNQQLKKNIEDLNNDISSLKNELTSSSTDNKEENRQNVTENLPDDIQSLMKDNNSLKLEIEEYKKILSEELEFRKDILKLFEDLKK